MIQMGTFLKVVDNSGAISASCIKVLRGNSNCTGNVGDVVVCTIRESLPSKKVSRKDVCKALIVSTRFRLYRASGLSFRCFHNSVILLTGQKIPVGSRVKIPLFRELRKKKYARVLSMTSYVL